MELIAHRAGNRAGLISPAVAVADAIELDVHLFRGRLEVRHTKVLWPLAVYWERWELVRDEPPVPLAEIVAAAPDGTHLWLDLKGFTPRLARRALEAVGDRRPLTASTRSWWALGPLRRAGVRTFRSVGSRWQLWLVERVPIGGDGIVMHQRFATPEVVARLRRRTRQVVVWAIEDADRALAVADLGVTGIIADDLAVLAAVRAGVGPSAGA